MILSPQEIADIFSIFHDGVMVHCRREGDTLHIAVEIDYLAKRIDPNFKVFSVALHGVSDVTFRTWPRQLGAEPEVVQDAAHLLGRRMDILEGHLRDGEIEIVCNQADPHAEYCGGEFRIRCTTATVTDPTERAYGIEELDALCKDYWEEWSRRTGPNS